MPLHSGTSAGVVSNNIREMRNAGHSEAQSVAAAMRQKDQSMASGGVVHGYAFGGAPSFNGTKPLPEPKSFMPPYVRSEMRQGMHSGAIASSVAGRQDLLPLNVRQGSYVIPADVTSGLGQGNTAAGHNVINRMFGGGPYGVGLHSQRMGSLMRPPSAPRAAPMPGMPKFADGGAVPIKAAGGEHVLDPETVIAVGRGDWQHGSDVLDAWVKNTRAKIIKEMKALPGPAK